MSDSAALAGYLQKEYPKFTATEGSSGYTWLYRYPNASLTKPAVGDVWADGNVLTSVDETPSLDNSGFNELTVSTVYSTTDGGPATTTLEEVRYQIRWNPTQLPLIRHPYFQGQLTDTERKNIIGWEYEQDPELKIGFEYKKLDSNGVPSSTITTIPSGGKDYDFVNLRSLGFDSYTEFTPTWQKVSIYRGQNVPEVGSIGQYVAAESVPELPNNVSGFDFIKSADSAERIGTQARWQRTEEWTGFTRVYFDTDSFDPAGYLA